MVGNPRPGVGGRYFVFVQLVTDDGVVGIGEVYPATFHPRATARMIDDVVERHVDGADPFPIEPIWRRVYARGYTARPDLTLCGVLSGIEIACWDIVGKEAGRPVYELLGGRVHERLRSYTYLYAEAGDPTDVYHDPDFAARARGRVRRARLHRAQVRPRGEVHDARPAPALAGDARPLRALRRGRPRGRRRAVDLLLGTHGQFTTAGAIRLARRVERFDPLWFEEPVPPERPEEMARVATRDLDPGGDRRAADDEVRVRPRARDGRGRDPPAEPRPGRRAAGGEEDRGAWPRPTTRRSHRTSTAGRSSARRPSSSRRAPRTS